MIRKTTLAMLAVAAMFASGCERKEKTTTEPATPEARDLTAPTDLSPESDTTRAAEKAMDHTAEPAAAPATEPTAPGALGDTGDRNVLAELTAIHGTEVILASMVVDKTQDPSVKQMAQMVMQDHRAGLDQVMQLEMKTGIKPLDDEMSLELKTKTLTDHISELAPLTGAELDRKFTELMAEGHKKVLERVNGEMLLKAKSPEIKAYLEAVRPSLVHHQEMAEKLLEQMKS